MSDSKKNKFEFDHCPYSGLNFLRKAFPKTCSMCKTVYQDHAEFIKNTAELPGGKYSKGFHNHFLEYRNCSCGSTMACIIENRRDASEEGNILREDFDAMLKDLMDNGFTEDQARKYLLDELEMD